MRRSGPPYHPHTKQPVKCLTCRRFACRTTSRECSECRNLLCSSCNFKNLRAENSRQCANCASRDTQRAQKATALRRLYSEDSSPDKQYCEKCKQVRDIGCFKRKPGSSSDHAPTYQTTCHRCLKRPRPSPNMSYLKEGSCQDMERMHGDYIASINQLITEIRGLSQYAAPVSAIHGHFEEFLRIVDYHNTLEDVFAPMITLEEHLSQSPGAGASNHITGASRQVLRASTAELRHATLKGLPLPDTPCIYIPRDEYTPLVSDERFMLALKIAWEHTDLEYQNFSMITTQAQPTKLIPGSDFYKRIQDRRSPEKRRLQRDVDILNLLNLSGAKLKSLHRRPYILDVLGYRLLRDLVDMVEGRYDRDRGKEGLGKASLRGGQHVDLESCLEFVLYGERGVITPYHVDVLNGTYVVVASGYKLWFVPSRRLTPDEETAFGIQGSSWRPAADLFRAVLLQPGDSLIMRPGYLIPHMVVTGDDSLTFGGMEWTTESLPRTMQQLRYIIPRYHATNEDVPRQITQILDQLHQFVTREDLHDLPCDLIGINSPRNRASVGELIAWLKEKQILYCLCEGKCASQQTCPCHCIEGMEDSTKRTHAGCTKWCHPGKNLACHRAFMPT